MGTCTGIGIQLLESLTLGRVVATLFLLTIGSFVVDIIAKPRYPKSIPHAGNGDGLIGKVKNWLGYITKYNDWAAEGYEKVRARSIQRTELMASLADNLASMRRKASHTLFRPPLVAHPIL